MPQHLGRHQKLTDQNPRPAKMAERSSEGPERKVEAYGGRGEKINFHIK